MKKIKVGEYVRIIYGIFKVVAIDGYYIYLDKLYYDKQYETMRNVTFKENIVKHSKNIIDLIEVGDLVFVYDVLNNEFVYIWDEEVLKALKEDIQNGIEIKSVLTHEQYQANCYTVERKEEKWDKG